MAWSMKSKMSWWPKGQHITACTFLNGPSIKHKETLWERVIFLDDPDTVCGVWGYSVLDSPAWTGSGLCSCSPVSCKITWVWQIPSKWNLTLVVVLSPLLCYSPSPSPLFLIIPTHQRNVLSILANILNFLMGGSMKVLIVLLEKGFHTTCSLRNRLPITSPQNLTTPV